MKPMSNKWTKAILALTLATGLAACGNQSGAGTTAPQTPAPAEQAAEPAELTIALDWYPNAVHSFLYAAEEQGFFKEENLKVNLQMPSDSNDPLKMAAAKSTWLSATSRSSSRRAPKGFRSWLSRHSCAIRSTSS